MKDTKRIAAIRARHPLTQGTYYGGAVPFRECRECEQNWPCDAIFLADALTAAQGEVERLRVALVRYAKHDPTCAGFRFHPCSCGLEEGLAERAEGKR